MRRPVLTVANLKSEQTRGSEQHAGNVLVSVCMQQDVSEWFEQQLCCSVITSCEVCCKLV